MDHCSDKAVTGKKEEKVVSKSCRLVKGGGASFRDRQDFPKASSCGKEKLRGKYLKEDKGKETRGKQRRISRVRRNYNRGKRKEEVKKGSE